MARIRCSYCHAEDLPLHECHQCSTAIHIECRTEHGGSCPICGLVPAPPKIRAYENIYRRMGSRTRLTITRSSVWGWDAKALIVGVVLILLGLLASA